MIVSLLSQIPALGPIIMFVVMFSILGIFMALIISSMVGIYYRYAEIEDDETLNIEDHLVSE